MIAAVLLAGFAAACAPVATTFGPAKPTPPGVHRVAIAYDISGRGDGGFNDLAWAGAKRWTDESGAELAEVTARPDDTDDDRTERLRLLAGSGFDAIIAVGFTYAAPLETVAQAYPRTFFAIVDDGTVDLPNVYDIVFAEQEGSFLVGAAAALTTTSDHVGFIGAVQIPLIQKFEAGYTAGVHHVDPGITVDATYLSQPPDYSGFGDPPHGKEAALGMYQNGVDVIFAAAGGSGSGVHEAAAATGHWSIGVDADEYQLQPTGIREHILTSMLKRSDVATYAFLTVAGSLVPTVGGVHVFGLANDGVGYATSGGFVDPIRAELDALAAQVIDGTIVVPETP